MADTVSVQPGQNESEPDLVDVGRILRPLLRNWHIVLAATLAMALVAAVLNKVIPPTWEARAALLVSPSQRPPIMGEIPAIDAAVGGASSVSTFTVLEAIKTETVAQRALAKLPRDMRTQLPGTIEDLPIRVRAVLNSDVVWIEARSGDRAVCTRLANAMADSYTEIAEALNLDIAREARGYLNPQLEVARARLREANLRLARVREREGVFDIAAEREATLTRLNDLRTEWLKQQAELNKHEASLRALEASIASQSPKIVTATTTERNPVLQQTDSILTSLLVEREGLLASVGPGSPEVREIDRKIAEARQRNRQATRVVDASQTEGINQINVALVQQRELEKEAIAASRAHLSSLAKAIAEEEKEIRRLDRLAALFDDLQLEREAQFGLCQMVAKKAEDLGVSARVPLATVRILSPATPPKTPVAPRKILNILLGATFGLLVSAGWALYREGARRR
jgi:uncharacterized protein involved in exopolysaccharide biosynthesis